MVWAVLKQSGEEQEEDVIMIVDETSIDQTSIEIESAFVEENTVFL